MIAVVGGGLILFPSLALLFTLRLGGQLGDVSETAESAAGAPASATQSVQQVFGRFSAGLLVRACIGCLLAGIGFLTIATRAGRTIGVVFLFGFIALGFCAVLPLALADEAPPTASN